MPASASDGTPPRRGRSLTATAQIVTRAFARYLRLRPADPRYRARATATDHHDPPAPEAPREVNATLRMAGGHLDVHLPPGMFAEVHRLFGDAVAAVDPPRRGRPDVAVFTAPGGVHLSFAGAPPSTHDDVEALTVALGRLTRMQLAAEPGLSHLHAAAVVVDGRAVVVPGTKGTGKSTLAAHLAAGGELMNDEIVAVDRQHGVVRAEARPITVKPGSRSVVAPLLANPAARPAWLSPADIGASHRGFAAPGTIVVARRGDDAPGIVPVSRAVAFEHLLLNAYDLPRTPAERLPQLAWLAASSTCVEVTYVEAADAVPAVLDVARRRPPAPSTVDHRRMRRDADDAGPGSVHVLTFDDECVVYVEASRLVVRLPADELAGAHDGAMVPAAFGRELDRLEERTSVGTAR